MQHVNTDTPYINPVFTICLLPEMFDVPDHVRSKVNASSSTFSKYVCVFPIYIYNNSDVILIVYALWQ